MKSEEVRVCKTFHWDAAHHLVLPYVSPCTNVHGHTYVVSVSVEGSLDKNGMVLDFTVLKKWVEKCSFDHKHINDDVKYFIDANPTAENLVLWLKRALETERPNFDKLPKICKIRIWETPNSYAEKEW